MNITLKADQRTFGSQDQPRIQETFLVFAGLYVYLQNNKLYPQNAFTGSISQTSKLIAAGNTKGGGT